MSLSPLQDLSGLPRFSDITPDQIQPSVEQAIEDAKKTIETLLAQPSYTWDNFAAKLEDKDDELGRMWSPVSHMNSVVSNDELREAHDACLPLLSEYGTWVGQHKGLYQAYLQIQNSAKFAELDEAKRKVIDLSLIHI